MSRRLDVLVPAVLTEVFSRAPLTQLVTQYLDLDEVIAVVDLNAVLMPRSRHLPSGRRAHPFWVMCRTTRAAMLGVQQAIGPRRVNMSDTQERMSTTGSQINEARGQEAFQQTTGWGGMVIFAATMLIMLGAFQAIAGLVAIFDPGYYLVGQSGLVVEVDYTTWGWVHLIVGVLAFAGGLGLVRGATWARVVGICIAWLSAVVNFAFIPAYPFWSIAMITVDVLVIYAIAAHGREVTSYMVER